MLSSFALARFPCLMLCLSPFAYTKEDFLPKLSCNTILHFFQQGVGSFQHLVICAVRLLDELSVVEYSYREGHLDLERKHHPLTESTILTDNTRAPNFPVEPM